ncbi:MAG: succinate dehydrogenase [Candidatus Micrarchaeales archaeon]
MGISDTVKSVLPGELLESNLRLYSFIILLILTITALFLFPVAKYKGYIDPFYSPTILVLPFVGLYRITCYAYRKDYNRHVFKHPLNCPASERYEEKSRKYTGETSNLFRIENYHRYFLYASILILPFFYYDAYTSIFYAGSFILRLGSILIAINAVLLTIYVFSCHSFRNIFGGRVDCYSCMHGGKQVKKAYDIESWFNSHHELIAWASLIFIIFLDLYLRGLSAGLPLDFRMLG